MAPSTPTIEMADRTGAEQEEAGEEEEGEEEGGQRDGGQDEVHPVSINELRAMAVDLRDCVRALEVEREGELAMVQRYAGARPIDDEVRHVRARYSKVIQEKQELAEAYELQAETLMSVPVIPYTHHVQVVEAAGKAKDKAVLRLKREMEVLRRDQMEEMGVIRARAGKREMDLVRELDLVRRDLDQATGGRQTRVAPRGSSLARGADHGGSNSTHNNDNDDDDDDNNNGKGKIYHQSHQSQQACVSLGLGAFFGL